MQRMALICLMATVAYFSYQFMRPSFSVAEPAPTSPQRSELRTECARLAAVGERMRQSGYVEGMRFPDPSPERLFSGRR